MDNQELLNLILSEIQGMKSEMQDMKKSITGLENRLDIIELKQDRTTKKLEDLQLDVKIAERDIRRDIYTLKDEMETVIEIIKLNDLIPR